MNAQSSILPQKLNRESVKNPKVLFIIHDVYQDDNLFPLGIAYLATVLRKNNIDVAIYSQDVFHYTNEQLAEYLDENEFDIIGLGFMAARFKETAEPLCDIINKHKKNAWFVIGGACPSAIPQYMLLATDADIVAVGEAEETIVELVKYKTKGGDLSKVKGIVHWRGITERRQPIMDLDTIPFPDWSIFPMDNYTSCLQLYGAKKKDIAFSILTSRGCINRCNFCYRMEKGIRVRSIENIIEEMKLLYAFHGVNYFEIEDELFILSKERIRKFRDAIKKAKLKIKFYCQARVDIFDEEIAELLKEAGCQFLNFGMESSDQKVLDLMNKRTTVEQNINAAEITRKMGIGVGLNFIWGNIGDTEHSLKENVELIKNFNTYNQIRTIRPVTPYPGCDLYYEAIKRGLLTGPEDFFNKFKNSDLLTVNFTDIPDERFYELLYEANKDLINDHFHQAGNMVGANALIDNFYNLYFKGAQFRGARHYVKNNSPHRSKKKL